MVIDPLNSHTRPQAPPLGQYINLASSAYNTNMQALMRVCLYLCTSGRSPPLQSVERFVLQIPTSYTDAKVLTTP